MMSCLSQSSSQKVAGNPAVVLVHGIRPSRTIADARTHEFPNVAVTATQLRPQIGKPEFKGVVGLAVAESNAAFGEIVRGQLQRDLISRQDANAIPAEPACQVRQHNAFML